MCYMLPRYSPMTNPISDVMMKILDSGIIDHIFEMRSPYRSAKNQVNSYDNL